MSGHIPAGRPSPAAVPSRFPPSAAPCVYPRGKWQVTVAPHPLVTLRSAAGKSRPQLLCLQSLARAGTRGYESAPRRQGARAGFRCPRRLSHPGQRPEPRPEMGPRPRAPGAGGCRRPDPAATVRHAAPEGCPRPTGRSRPCLPGHQDNADGPQKERVPRLPPRSPTLHSGCSLTPVSGLLRG